MSNVAKLSFLGLRFWLPLLIAGFALQHASDIRAAEGPCSNRAALIVCWRRSRAGICFYFP